AHRFAGLGLRQLSGAGDGRNQRLPHAPKLAAFDDAEGGTGHAALLGADRLRPVAQSRRARFRAGLAMRRRARGIRRRLFPVRLLAVQNAEVDVLLLASTVVDTLATRLLSRDAQDSNRCCESSVPADVSAIDLSGAIFCRSGGLRFWGSVCRELCPLWTQLPG